MTPCCSALLDWLPRSLGIEAQMSRNLENKNEARIIQDISRLIVPSAESLALLNMNHKRLVESVNEGWNNSIPLTSTRPQPDYSVGFKRDALRSRCDIAARAEGTVHPKAPGVAPPRLGGCVEVVGWSSYMYPVHTLSGAVPNELSPTSTNRLAITIGGPLLSSVLSTCYSTNSIPGTRTCSLQPRVAHLWAVWPPRVVLNLLKLKWSPPSH